MENAVDALKMAGSVLLFVIALSVVIPLFSQARTTADAIMSYADRQGDVIRADEANQDEFFYVSTPTKNRQVNVGDILPTIYRSFAEKTKVVFCKDNDLNIPLPLYTYKGTNNQGENGQSLMLNRIDLEQTSITDHNEQEIFIQGILFGIYKPTIISKLGSTTFEQKFKVEVENSIRNDGLYRLFKR